MNKQIRTNLTLDNDGMSGVFEYLQDLKPKKRAQAIRLLLTIGHLVMRENLKITAADLVSCSTNPHSHVDDVDFATDLMSTIQLMSPTE